MTSAVANWAEEIESRNAHQQSPAGSPIISSQLTTFEVAFQHKPTAQTI